MRGGRNCLTKDFGAETNAASFVTWSSCLSKAWVAGASTIRVQHELQMAERVQGKRWSEHTRWSKWDTFKQTIHQVALQKSFSGACKLQGFRAWKQCKKQLYFLGERAGCFTINSVLASALIGVMNARYIRLALSFDCQFLPIRVFFLFKKGKVWESDWKNSAIPGYHGRNKKT